MGVTLREDNKKKSKKVFVISGKLKIEHPPAANNWLLCNMQIHSNQKNLCGTAGVRPRFGPNGYSSSAQN